MDLSIARGKSHPLRHKKFTEKRACLLVLHFISLISYNRGISAVGSAPHWQCGGQGFKSPMLHHTCGEHYASPQFFILYTLYFLPVRTIPTIEPINANGAILTNPHSKECIIIPKIAFSVLV